jgi:hypothetical protein
MFATDLLIYLLATTGLSLTVTWSKIGRPLRDLFDIGEQNRKAHDNPFNELEASKRQMASHFVWNLLTCSFCFAFWGGFVIYFLMGAGEVGYAICLSLSSCTMTYAIYSLFYK